LSEPIGITGIHHHSVVSTDLEKTRRFYSGVLEMDEVAYPSTFKFEVTWYKLGDQQLHIMLREEPDAVSPRHIALFVKDCKAARTTLAKKGISIEETVKIPGADRFFIHDPDGNRIELIEWQVPWGEGPM
jgi:catechol 2,3-dioxygenase-like lactoylglutathione lyase family enzyme